MAVTVQQFNMSSGLCDPVVYAGISLPLTVPPTRMDLVKSHVLLQTQPAKPAAFGFAREHEHGTINSQSIRLWCSYSRWFRL